MMSFYTSQKDTSLLPKILDNTLAFFSTAKGGDKAIINSSYSSDFDYTSDIYIGSSVSYNKKTGKPTANKDSYYDAGLIVRASELKVGASLFKGYYCYISTTANVAAILRYDNKNIYLKSVPLKVNAGTWYKLKVKCVGDEISFFVNDMSKPLITVKDATYKEGHVGLRQYSSEGHKYAFYDNITLNKIK